MSKEEYIEHEIVDRLYCIQEQDFDKTKVTDDYIQAVLKAAKENKKLVDKQQKEIEEKERLLIAKATIIRALEKENEELHKQVDIEFVEENYIEKSKVISKDKIRDKIKELEEIKNKGDMAQYIAVTEKIKILNELLGE